jgi:hypothetical protein
LTSVLSRAGSQDGAKLKELLGEKMFLDEELQKLSEQKLSET